MTGFRLISDQSTNDTSRFGSNQVRLNFDTTSKGKMVVILFSIFDDTASDGTDTPDQNGGSIVSISSNLGANPGTNPITGVDETWSKGVQQNYSYSALYQEGRYPSAGRVDSEIWSLQFSKAGLNQVTITYEDVFNAAACFLDVSVWDSGTKYGGSGLGGFGTYGDPLVPQDTISSGYRAGTVFTGSGNPFEDLDDDAMLISITGLMYSNQSFENYLGFQGYTGEVPWTALLGYQSGDAQGLGAYLNPCPNIYAQQGAYLLLAGSYEYNPWFNCTAVFFTPEGPPSTKPPMRQHPRDDKAGSARVKAGRANPPKSTQSSARVGFRGTYT
jgi:hypothetical protein